MEGLLAHRPSVLVVGLMVRQGFSDLMLPAVRDFRTSGRIPVAVWRHPGNGAVIVRCSQPRVGLTLQQNFEDEHLLRIIRYSFFASSTHGTRHTRHARHARLTTRHTTQR